MRIKVLACTKCNNITTVEIAVHSIRGCVYEMCDVPVYGVLTF